MKSLGEILGRRNKAFPTREPKGSGWMLPFFALGLRPRSYFDLETLQGYFDLYHLISPSDFLVP